MQRYKLVGKEYRAQLTVWPDGLMELRLLSIEAPARQNFATGLRVFLGKDLPYLKQKIKFYLGDVEVPWKSKRATYAVWTPEDVDLLKAEARAHPDMSLKQLAMKLSREHGWDLKKVSRKLYRMSEDKELYA